MLGAGPYTNLVRSYNVPYNVTVALNVASGSYNVAENAEDWVNFELLYFFAATIQTGSFSVIPRLPSATKTQLTATTWPVTSRWRQLTFTLIAKASFSAFIARITKLGSVEMVLANSTVSLESYISLIYLSLYNLFTCCPDGSQVDLSGATLADINFSQNQQAVTTAAISLDIKCDLGPLDVTLCTAADSNYLCFFVRHQNETASFRDDVTVNNVQCMDMSVNKICHPGRTKPSWGSVFIFADFSIITMFNIIL